MLLHLPGERTTRLVGVEHFVPEAAAEGITPTLLGVPFDGPMDGHSTGMPRHHDLHVWTWRHNPSGMVAPWNPSLHCPG